MSFAGYDRCEDEANKIAERYKNTDHVVEHMEKDLGADFSNVRFHSQPSLGEYAYTKGKDVFFGEGMERPEVISHELVHTMQQGYGESTGMVTQTAPEGSVQGWGLGQHKKITELAYKLASGDNKVDKEKLKSLKAGATFNDIGQHSMLGFGLNYVFHTDEYINESHHGSMQALHTMNSSTAQSALDNYNQQLAYAELCVDVGIGDENILNGSLFDYVVGSKNDYLKKMFYPVFIDRKVMKDLQQESGGDQEKLWKMIVQEVWNGERLSKYVNMSIKDFFTNGNKKLDAKFVAQGSLAHMLEDSFANSHAQRGVNVNLEASGIQEAVKSKEIAARYLNDKDKILGGTTKALLHQDYNKQHSVLAWGKHSHGDGFEKNKQGFFSKIKNFFKETSKEETSNEDMLITQGANQAQMAVAYVLKAMEGDNNLIDKEDKKEDVMGFVRELLKVDENVLILDSINKQRKNGKNREILNKIADKSTAFKGLNFENEYAFTKGGRQYERTFESGGWMKEETNPEVKKLLKQYDAMLKEETYNKIFDRNTLSDKFEKQTEMMIEIFMSEKASIETKKHLSNHAMELLVHIANLIEQCGNNNDAIKTKLETIRITLVNAMNYAFN